jgi:hypothetical protein
VVSFGWTASPDPTVTNYALYYGPASGSYTNSISVGNVTNASVTLPARGVNFFFVVTAQAGGLESLPSNEVSYTAKAPPGAPGLKNPIALIVESRPPAGVWADSGMNWSLSADQASQFFRLRILEVSQAPQVSAQARALEALHRELSR